MSVTTTSERPVKKWRVIVFGVFTVLLALAFTAGSLDALRSHERP